MTKSKKEYYNQRRAWIKACKLSGINFDWTSFRQGFSHGRKYEKKQSRAYISKGKAYEAVCESLGIEKDILGYIKNLKKQREVSKEEK